MTYTRPKTSGPAARDASQWAAQATARSQGIADDKDAGEREADRSAKAMQGDSTKRHWSISETSIAASAMGNNVGPASAVAATSLDEVLNSPGQPLDRSTRDFFEPKFGKDLGKVRLHTGEPAAKSGRALNASAFTIGSDVVFGAGGSPEQKPLLAHELAHVVQQNQAPGFAAEAGDTQLEAEAESTAAAISGGTGFAAIHTQSGPRISRQVAAPVASPALSFLTAQDMAKLQVFGPADFQASLQTLEKMLSVTGDVTKAGLARQYVSTRQASGELRTFLDLIRDPDIQALKVVPSGPGGRSPDLYFRRVSGAEGRVEVVNITAASSATRAELGPNGERRIPHQGTSVVRTVEEVDTVAKLREAIRVKIKAGSQLSAQNPNTGVGGRAMQTGGEVRVSTSHIELSRSEVDSVIRDLQAELGSSAADKVVVDTIDAADARAGRKLFEYVRDEQGTFRFSGLRTSFARASATTAATDATADAATHVAGDLEPAAANALAKVEQEAGGHSLGDIAGSSVAKAATGTAEKDLSETAAEAFTQSATSTATRRVAQAAAPLVGVAFAAPDAWRGLQDLAHGDVFTGLGTIGVAIIDVASQGLHLTDEVTAGGGTVLAITIQTWAAAMQFGFESERIRQRASELKSYMKAHGNKLPPRDELMSYYGLNDEDILILENDIFKAQQNRVTTEDLAKQVKALLAKIDENVNKPLPDGVTPEGIQRERASLSKLLVALEADVQQKRARDARERTAAEEKRRQQNYDRAVQQQKQAAQQPPPQQLLPTPGSPAVQPQGQGANDPFGLFGGQRVQPLNNISPETAELAATGAGRSREALLLQYGQLEARHFPSENVTRFQEAVAKYVSDLDKLIDMFVKKGSREWQGVQSLLELRDRADNADRSKLMR